jgi:hypothetical protein
VLYYDRETETFWEQMTGKAVVGPRTGKRLAWVPSVVTTWKKWREAHPATTVLKPPHPLGAYKRTNANYERYRRTDRAHFLDSSVKVGKQYRNKDSVTIVVRDGRARCYPHPALQPGVNSDGDLKVIRDGRTVRVKDKDGREVPSLLSYWFAWCAYYPKGSVYSAKK